MSAASTRLDALLSAVAPAAGGVVSRTFRLMGVAEEEIAEAKRRCPRKARALHAAFGALCPGILSGYGEDLYRAHVREILGRVRLGEDLRPGTDAEVLAVFSGASLRAPLSSDFAHAMSAVFFRVYPGADPDMRTGSEGWEGRTEEIIADVRRGCSREDRGGPGAP